MKKCFLYYRVSSESQAEKSGISRQETLLRDYVAEKNLLDAMDDPNPVELYDRGVSGWKGHNLTGQGELGRLIEQIKSGIYDRSIIVTESIDRISRLNPFVVMGYLSMLVEHDVDIHDVSLRMVISKANSHLLPLVTMTSQRAYDESVLKSDRISSGWRAKRINALANGTIITKKRPLWIDVVDDKYVLNGKAHIVKEVFRLYQTGLGCPTVAKVLNERGTEWQFNHPWRADSVHKLLKNLRVTGQIFLSEIIRDFSDKAEHPVIQKKYEKPVYPPVIELEEFQLVQKLLHSRRNVKDKAGVGKVTGGKHEKIINGEKFEIDAPLIKSNIFSSICRCGMCGEAMYHCVIIRKRFAKRLNRDVTSEYRYFRCLGERDGFCKNKALDYRVCERFIIEHIKKVDFTSVINGSKHNPEVDLLRMRIQEEQQHIEDYEEGIAEFRKNDRKVPFKALVELEESQTKLADLLLKYEAVQEITVDVDALANIDTSLVYDVSNVEIRSRVENELRKVVSRIEFIRFGKKDYVLTIKYNDTDVLKHVLAIRNNREPELISSVSIIRKGNITTYTTPSFTLSYTEGEDVPVMEAGSELNMIHYSLLLNYIDSVERSSVVANWMRHNMAFLFSQD